MSARRAFALWRSDERGQDLIEWALLAGTIAFAGLVAVQTLGGAMKEAYESWDEGVQELSTETPGPSGS